MLEESQVISPVPNLFLWDPARFRPAVPQIKCQERGELVLISPVYDYGETGYIGNMQLPPQHTDITHISMGNSAIMLCVHQWQIKGKERLLCVILCNNSCCMMQDMQVIGTLTLILAQLYQENTYIQNELGRHMKDPQDEPSHKSPWMKTLSRCSRRDPCLFAQRTRCLGPVCVWTWT